MGSTVYATGLKEGDMNKAQVGISSVGIHMLIIRRRDVNRIFGIL